MGCGSCSKTVNGVPQGCGNNGHCTSGGCNKKNTYDWLSDMEIHDPDGFEIVEVSFRKGTRQSFYLNPLGHHVVTGDMVVVQSNSGQDVGRISLSGELVRLQMKKKKFTEDKVIYRILKRANERDLSRLEEARLLERDTMIRARVIARTLGLEMKIGDVEYQGDKRKVIFYYTAEGRIDFRELVRSYAREFKVKVEMRQIGARQESAMIGGIGSCGRELCCSTWLSDFKSVSTAAARYQNIAINQTKLSGQCGRLKCCLNYELDTYMDALQHFPKRADTLKTRHGRAHLVKTDIFKGLMYYSPEMEGGRRGPILALNKDRVIEILDLNKIGEYPNDLHSYSQEAIAPVSTEPEIEFADVTGQIELPGINKRRGRGRGKGRGGANKPRGGNQKRKRGNRPKGSGNNKPKK